MTTQSWPEAVRLASSLSKSAAMMASITTADFFLRGGRVKIEAFEYGDNTASGG